MHEAPFRMDSTPAGTASPVPEAGWEPAAELPRFATRAARLVKQRAEAAETGELVRAFAAAIGNPPASEPTESATGALADRLLSHLERHYYFVLQVTAHGFVAGRRRCDAQTGELGARLHADGLAEILVKRGLTRDELQQLLGILHADESRSGHSAATRLWEARLPHVVCRFVDEHPGAGDDPRHDLDSWGESCPEAEEPFEVASLAPGSADAAWPSWVTLTPEDRARLRSMQLENPSDAAVRLARRLAVLHGVSSDPARRQASLDVLGHLVDALFDQREFGVLQSVLETLQEEAGAGVVVPETALEHVVQALCSQPHIMILGAALEEQGSWPQETLAVRNFLAALPGALDPLCRLLLRQEDMQARKLTCRVLAAVAKDDPGALAAHANGQPWYLARNLAYVLGRIGSARTVPILKRWVKHEDEHVRIEVARALGRVRDPGAAPLLGEMLADCSWRVRQTAVWALAGRAESDVLPQLRQILFEDRTFRTRRPEERDDFFRTYGRLADGPAFAELVQVLEQRSLVCIGWQAELRRGAALALGETERPEAARVLRLHVQERDPRLREAVVTALRNLRARVSATLDDPEDWNRPALRAARRPMETGFQLDFAVEK